MAYDIPGKSITLPAAADLSAAQYSFVKVDANGRAALCSVLGERADGVLQNKPNAIDQPAEILLIGGGGVSKVKFSGTINPGTVITTDANGKAVAATTGRTDTSDAGAANDPLKGSYGLGTVLVDGGANNQYGSVALQTLGAVPQTLL
jgi:hypothetical protein